MSESIRGIMDVTMDKLRSVVDAETVIGDPIKVDDVTLIPVSKIAFGLASGGSDFASKHTQKDLFGGGGGAGVTITPVAFLVIHNDNVRMMPVYSEMNTVDKAINMAPDILDKVKSLVSKDK